MSRDFHDFANFLKYFNSIFAFLCFLLFFSLPFSFFALQKPVTCVPFPCAAQWRLNKNFWKSMKFVSNREREKKYRKKERFSGYKVVIGKWEFILCKREVRIVNMEGLNGGLNKRADGMKTIFLWENATFYFYRIKLLKISIIFW